MNPTELCDACSGMNPLFWPLLGTLAVALIGLALNLRRGAQLNTRRRYCGTCKWGFRGTCGPCITCEPDEVGDYSNWRSSHEG